MTKEQQAQYAQFIEQQLKIEKFETQAIKELLAYYDTAKKAVLRDINTAIRKNYNHPSRIRLQALLKEIDEKIKTLTKLMTEPVAEVIGEAGAFSYTDTNRILSWDGKVDGFNYVKMSASQIAKMVKDETLGGHTLWYWMWDALNAENKALKVEINAARIRGIGYKKILKELGARYANLFDWMNAKQNLETVVKSYIQSTNAKSHKDLYEANSSIIKAVEWVAILENGNVKTGRGTCPRCMALDGTTYKTVATGPPCPLHPRCRCMYLPITKTWREMGFDIDEMGTTYRKWYERSPGRKILDRGEVEGDYADWWWTRDTEFQNNAVGPVRANLIRENVIDFNDIVYKNGNLIPIDRLGVSEEALTQARRRT